MTQVTTELLRSAVDWLTATGAPNWIVLLALLTSPWTWAKAIRSRVGNILDYIAPKEQGAQVAETPDEDPRE